MSANMITSYEEFLAAKQVTAPTAGFAVTHAHLTTHALFPFQRDIVIWAAGRGRSSATGRRQVCSGGVKGTWSRL